MNRQIPADYRHYSIGASVVRHRLMIGSAIVAMACLAGAPPLVAQTANPAAEEPSVDSGLSDSGPSTSDIIVTARRRAEQLSDVPISIQAFSGATLEQRGVSRTEDLVSVAPSLKMGASSGGRATPTYELRGISSLDPLGTDDQPVAIYMNEVYVARPTGTNQQLFDLESVQVLLGPQGTLFGRNSTAGAILFTSKKPTDQLEGEASITVGNYDRLDFAGILNLPVTDTLAIRLAGKRVSRDGYTQELNTGRDLGNENSHAVRGSIRWNPTPQIENTLIVDYAHADESGTAFLLHASRPGPISTRFGTAQLVLAQQALGVRQTRHNFPDFNRYTTWNVSNITSFELSDNLTLKNVIGYHKLKSSIGGDLDGSQAAILGATQQEDGHTWSEEFQVQADLFDNSLNLIVGGYYFKEDLRFTAQSFQLLPSATAPGTNDTSADNDSKSVFAQGTYKVPFLPGLSITAGGRYTWDRRQSTFDNPTVGTSPATCRLTDRPGAPTSPCIFTVAQSFKQPTYTFSLDYKPVDALLFYVAHRSGYRSGGFNTRANLLAQFTPFLPEKVKDIELGAKYNGRLGSMPATANLAVYRTKYDDIQRTTTGILGNPPQLTSSVINVGKATIKGFEFTTTIEPVRGFHLSGYWSYNDAQYDVVRVGTTDFFDIPFYNAKNSYGFAVAMTPVDTVAIGKVTFNGSYGHLDSFRDGRNIPVSEVEGATGPRDLVNASVEWANIAGSTFSATLFARNLFNETYVIGSQSFLSNLGFTYRQYGEPRMYGLSVKYAF